MWSRLFISHFFCLNWRLDLIGKNRQQRFLIKSCWKHRFIKTHIIYQLKSLNLYWWSILVIYVRYMDGLWWTFVTVNSYMPYMVQRLKARLVGLSVTGRVVLFAPNLAHGFLLRLPRGGRPCAARREEANALRQRRRGGLAGAQRHGRGLACKGLLHICTQIRHCLYRVFYSCSVSFLVYMVKNCSLWATAYQDTKIPFFVWLE